MELEKLPKEIQTAPQKVVRQRRYYFQGLLIFLIITFGILTYFAKSYHYFPFDLIITKEIQLYQASWFDFLMRFLSFLGDSVPGGITFLIAAGVLLGLRKKKDALMLFVSTAGVTILSAVLKTYVSRPRPDPTLILQIGHFSHTDSFPSGHVLFFMGFYGFLLFLAFTRLKKTWFRAVAISMLLILLVLISFSRIYLGAHWFSDILGSYLIGIVWLYLMIFLDHKIKL